MGEDILKEAVPYIMGIVFIGIILGAGAIALVGMTPITPTSSGEILNATASTPATLSGKVISVTQADLATVIVSNNTTILGTAGTRIVYLNAGAISALNYSELRYNMTITAQVNGSDLVKLTSNCNSESVLTNGVNVVSNLYPDCLRNPYLANFTFNNSAASSNITNVSISYYYWNPTTSYSVSSGILTPTYTGFYKLNYTYSTAGNYYTTIANNNALLGITNLSGQFPTLGTIIGVSLIIVILFAGVGIYVFNRR